MLAVNNLVGFGGNVPRFLYEDFGGMPIAAGIPNGFTNRLSAADMSLSIQAEGIAGSVSGKEFKVDITAGSSIPRAITFDAAGEAHSDVEVLISGYAVSLKPGSFGIWLRFSESGGSNATGYRFALSDIGGQNNARLAKHISGSTFNIAVASKYWSNNRWFLRFRANGNSLRARYWLATDPEPGSWDIDETDGDITSPGSVGFYAANVDADKAFDWISVAFNGESAPLPSEV